MTNKHRTITKHNNKQKTCLVFASGKIVIAGAKSEEEITTENSLLKLLDQFLIDKNGRTSLAKAC